MKVNLDDVTGPNNKKSKGCEGESNPTMTKENETNALEQTLVPLLIGLTIVKPPGHNENI